MEMKQVERFASLFAGNVRSFGIFNPKTSKMRTEHRQYTIDDYSRHLTGEMGMGVVPIMDDGTCWFGAIDIDAHGDAPDVDLVALEKKVRENDLPLMVCRSKSGGAHLYLFGAEPINANLVRNTLTKWAEMIGYGGVEVFPKQSKLPKDKDGTQQLGNWINLCMFDSGNKDQLRYAVEGGRRVDLDYFLDLADSRRLTGAMLVEKSETEHGGAPPCIQKMIADGVTRGHRNEGLYNICLYLKRAFPETWKDKAYDYNARVFDIPLKHEEAKKVIASTARKDYRYKCGEEPCRSLCKASVCVTRKYGITKEEKDEMELGKMPEFSNLRKIESDPVKWIVEVESQDVVLSTAELVDFRYTRNKVLEKINRILPPIKADRWALMLNALMKDCEVIEAPEDVSAAGMIRARLQEYIRKADASNTEKEARSSLLFGQPVVQDRDGRMVVYFRGTDFMAFLKKTKTEELKHSNMWVALREVGVKHTKLRVERDVIPVWYMDYEESETIDPLEVSVDL